MKRVPSSLLAPVRTPVHEWIRYPAPDCPAPGGAIPAPGEAPETAPASAGGAPALPGAIPAAPEPERAVESDSRRSGKGGGGLADGWHHARGIPAFGPPRVPLYDPEACDFAMLSSQWGVLQVSVDHDGGLRGACAEIELDGRFGGVTRVRLDYRSMVNGETPFDALHRTLRALRSTFTEG